MKTDYTNIGAVMQHWMAKHHTEDSSTNNLKNLNINTSNRSFYSLMKIKLEGFV